MGVNFIKDYKLRGEKVLVLEYDPAGSLLPSEILHKTNIMIQVVGSGYEAVDICNTGDHCKPDACY